MTDLVFVVLFIVIGAVGGWLLFKERSGTGKEKTVQVSLDSLSREAAEYLAGFGTKDSVTEAVRECCNGMKGPRDVVKTMIREWLFKEKCIKEEELDSIINDPGDCWPRFECTVYMADKACPEHGFEKLWNGWFRDIAMCCGEIGSLYVEDVYARTCDNMNFEDKLNVVTRLVYANSVGLGRVDSVMWQKGCIEEIQLGMSGCVAENYDYREVLKEVPEGKKYSRDSIHVLISGVPIKLAFLSFGSDDELMRTLRNLVKNTGAGELTRRNPRIVTDTPDGRRVTVSRPPFTDSWAGLVRKFDTVTKTTIEQLVEDPKLRTLLHELIHTRKSIAVTGETASGKTTMLRALLLEIGREKSIRVIESESFELNIREYLPEANTLTLRVSDRDSCDKVLGFSKKTTGQVFAVGEVNTPEMAVTLTDVAKTAEMILFTAHYKETADMVSDFTNARLNAGGYSDERLARSEAVSALGVDIHLRRKNGIRTVERISEVGNDGKIRCLWPLQAVG